MSDSAALRVTIGFAVGLTATQLGPPLTAEAQDAGLAEACWQRARAAERAHHPARAAAEYRCVIESAPSTRRARRARQRLAYFDAREEGDYHGLARMLALRSRPPAQLSNEELAAFGRANARAPRGLVRRESWALLGELWLTKRESERARQAFGALSAEPDASADDRALAAAGVARAIELESGPQQAAEYLRAQGLSETTTAREMAQRGLQTPLWWISVIAIVLYALAALATLMRTRAPRPDFRGVFRVSTIALAAYVVAGPPLIGFFYDAETLDTFVALGIGTAFVLLLSGLARSVGAPTGWPRAALIILATLAHVAVGYLALDLNGQVWMVFR